MKPGPISEIDQDTLDEIRFYAVKWFKQWKKFESLYGNAVNKNDDLVIKNKALTEELRIQRKILRKVNS